MPSKQAQAAVDYWTDVYRSWTGSEDEDPEAWGKLTMEPRGVDYIETEANGRTAMWAVGAFLIAGSLPCTG